jgi:hypothetical protein
MFAQLHERLKGWRTMIVSSGYTVAGTAVVMHDTIADAVGQTGVDWKQLIEPKYVPYLLIATGVTFALLRKVTKGPVGAKGNAEPAANVKAGD